MRGRRGRIRQQLLDALNEMRGCCKLKEEALNHTLWITGFGRGCRTVVRRTTEIINARIYYHYQCSPPLRLVLNQINPVRPVTRSSL
jgi:hypothetical protein